MKFLTVFTMVVLCLSSPLAFAQEDDWHGKTWAPNYEKEIGASPNLAVSANSLHACMLSSIYGHRGELEYARGMGGDGVRELADLCQSLSAYFIFRCQEASFPQADCYAMLREDASGALGKYLSN